MSWPKELAGNRSRLAGADHLRALAITLVFIFHYRMFGHPAWADNIGSFGWTGVDLFFVLSGYLIAGQLFKEIQVSNRIRLNHFYLKRAFRILPAYLAVLAIYFFIPAYREWEALAPLWKFLTFTQNLGLDLRSQRTFSHAWSLCIEEQFYLALPLVLIALLYTRLRKYGGLVILFFFILCIGLRLFSWYHYIEPAMDTENFGFTWYQKMYYPTYTRLDGLLVGISLAGLQQFYPRIKKKIDNTGNLLLVTGALLTVTAYFLCLDPYSFFASIFGFPVVALAYGFILAGVVSPSCLLYRLSSKITSGLATLSYGIYLTHKGIIHLTQEFGLKLNIEKDSNVMLLLCIISCILTAIVLRYAVEKPFLRLRDHILKNKHHQPKPAFSV